MDLQQYIHEIREELPALLHYWIQYTVDGERGGFYGKVDNNNRIYPDAPKGSVLNARILWTFAAAYNATAKPEYLVIADRAYRYIVDHFIDHTSGGVYWSVDAAGRPLDTKKQIYALAFVIYGCSEYYACNRQEEVKLLAIRIYELIQQHSYDAENGGYLEAFTRDWHLLAEMRLSAKDANEKKTMNTHLHILEAYMALYKIWPSDGLSQHITGLLYNFDEHFINKQTWHLDLFFNERWQVKPDVISYGHDIEAAWLLPEAAETVHHEELTARMKVAAIKIADAAMEGLDADGGLWYEYEPAHHRLIKQKHWWPQSEAQIGFFNAWQLSGNQKYLQAVLDNWTFTKQYIRDNRNGEWFWGIDENYAVMPGEDKAGLWKCPYHNCRAMLEIMKRYSKRNL